MTKVTIEEAQARLSGLIGERSASRGPRFAGFAEGLFAIASEDDDHLADFAESMP